MIAILRLALAGLSRTSGSCGLVSFSTMSRLTARIESGASNFARRHLLSQGWKQTEAQMAASGLRSRCSRSASA